MIDINKLFNEYSNYTSLNEGHYEYMLDKDDFKQALKEYTELLLKEAADKAKIEWGHAFNGDGYDAVPEGIDKESITSIINDINFD